MGNGFDTDPLSAQWYYNKQKTFAVFFVEGSHQQRKEAQRLAAFAWVAEQYGITEWVKDPFGAYQEADVMLRVAEKINGAR